MELVIEINVPGPSVIGRVQETDLVLEKENKKRGNGNEKEKERKKKNVREKESMNEKDVNAQETEKENEVEEIKVLKKFGRSRIWRGVKVLKKHRHLRLCP